MSKPIHTLAQSRRDALVAQIQSRGKKTANIWYVFCPGSRTDAVLLGDPKFELFLVTEGDPDILDANYEVDSVRLRIGEVEHAVPFDAFVRHADGRREYRDIRELHLADEPAQGNTVSLAWKVAAAESTGATYREFTFADLDLLKQRMWNWARATAALARCREMDLSTTEIEVAARLGDGLPHTIADLLTDLANESPAVVVAAAVSLLRKRRLRSDLDTKRWGRRTVLWMEEAPT